jgi:hypothetical protein
MPRLLFRGDQVASFCDRLVIAGILAYGVAYRFFM